MENVVMKCRVTNAFDTFNNIHQKRERDTASTNSDKINYLLTYDSYVPVHNRSHRGECITWASGGRGPWTLLGP